MNAQDAPKENKHTGPVKLVDLVNNVLDPVDRMDGDSEAPWPRRPRDRSSHTRSSPYSPGG